MSPAPWLTPDGKFRCFSCETRETRGDRGGDPDTYNVDLRESHRLLWSKPLPDGTALHLVADRAGYLKITTLTDRRTLGSDNFATTHANALPDFSSRLDDFAQGHLCTFCTIGGYIVFPNGQAQQFPTRVNGRARKLTPNQARGWERRVADRFDLTLEAIRLFYTGVIDRTSNPIGDVLEAYRWWFDLFGVGTDGFLAYTKFFFLTPLLDGNGNVRPFEAVSLHFDDALPRHDLGAYRSYVADQARFVDGRNSLITTWWSHHPRALL